MISIKSIPEIRSSYSPSRFVLACIAAGLITACGDAESVLSPARGPAYVRVINAVTNQGFLVPGTAIDVALDGGTASDVLALDIGQASPYQETTPGVHSFTAKITGDQRINGPENILWFGPRYNLVGSLSYSVLLMGVVPLEGVFNTGAVTPVLIPEDRFGPGTRADGSRSARLGVINAAVFSTSGGSAGGRILFFLTRADSAAPTSFTTMAPRLTINVGALGSVDVAAGTYILSLTNSATARVLLAQARITLSAGETMTHLLFSSGFGPGVPNMANHRLVALPNLEAAR